MSAVDSPDAAKIETPTPSKTKAPPLKRLIPRSADKIPDTDIPANSDAASKVFDKLKGDAETFAQAGDYDNAIKLLTHYNSDFERETLVERFELARKFEQKRDELLEKTQKAKTEILGPAVLMAFDNKISEAVLFLENQKQNHGDLSGLITDEIDVLLKNFQTFKNIDSDIQNAGKDADSILSENKAILQNSPMASGLVLWSKGKIKEAYEIFAKSSGSLPPIFNRTAKIKEPEQAFIFIFISHNITFDKTEPEIIVSKILESKMPAEEIHRLRIKIESFQQKYPDSQYLKDNAGILGEILKICSRNVEKTNEQDKASNVSDDICIEPATDQAPSNLSLFEALSKLKKNAKLFLKKGSYTFNGKVILPFSDFSIIGLGAVELNGDFAVNGSNIKFQNISQKTGNFVLDKHSQNISFENCRFNDRELTIVNSKNISFTNCLFRGCYIEEAKKISFGHCSFLSPKYGLDAALSLNRSEEFEIIDSLIYSETFAILLKCDKKDFSKKRQRIISQSLIFGEKGFLVSQDENKITEREVIDFAKTDKSKRMITQKDIIYSPPAFFNSSIEDWRLIKNTPGYNAASDGKDCGMLQDPK
jgi:hypothetical protein